MASIRTSACSERRRSIPRYPMRFSGKWGEAISFMHSSWPKWVGYPVVLENNDGEVQAVVVSMSISCE